MFASTRRHFEPPTFLESAFCLPRGALQFTNWMFCPNVDRLSAIQPHMTFFDHFQSFTGNPAGGRENFLKKNRSNV